MAEATQELGMETVDTGIVGAEQGDEFQVSHKAIDMINKVREENNLSEEHYLRIGCQSGGCSGMSYALGFDENINDFDRVYEVNGLNLVVDSKSIFYLMGVTLDYTEGPQGSGFVFKNPNNFNTCGCQG